MGDFPSLSRTAQIKETGGSTESCVGGRMQSRFTNRDVIKGRAHRLYAIGELKAAAQLFCELAAGGLPHQAQSQGEAIHG